MVAVTPPSESERLFVIAIGRLHVGAIQPEWLIAWEELKKPAKADGSPDWVTYSATRQVVHHARNEVVRSTLAQHPEATHLFFLDDDICMPPDGLLRLLGHNMPVVTGLYIQRGVPFLPVVYRRTPEGRHMQITQFCDGLQVIDACGAGCLLIRTDVLRAIAATGEPWFDWPPSGIAEDLAFCARVQALGFPILLDFGVKCTHLTTIEVTYEVFAQRLAEGLTFETDALARMSQEVRPWPPADLAH